MRWQLTFTTRGGVIFKSTNLNAPQGAGYHDKDRSVEAYQAQAEAVQHRVFCFWNRAPPLGIFQVPRRILIDVDKFGVTIERCNRKKGVGTEAVLGEKRWPLWAWPKAHRPFMRLSLGIPPSPQMRMEHWYIQQYVSNIL